MCVCVYRERESACNKDIEPVKILWLLQDCRVKASCLHVRPGPRGECPPWGYFQRNLARMNESFRKNH